MDSVSSTDRNYTNILNGSTDKTNSADKVYNAVFSDKDNSDVSVSDFFNMMITQLTNQDFMNPVDDTQYLAQLAQFASMNAMQELSEHSQQSYAMSFLGKECTASKYNIGGGIEKTTGKVTSVSLVDNDYKLTINGKEFSLSQIMTVNDNDNASSETKADSKSEQNA